MNGGIVFCRDFLDQARVGVVYILMLKNPKHWYKSPLETSRRTKPNACWAVKLLLKKMIDSNRPILNAISPKKAIDTKEPSISENGMISASGGTGFIGSNFVFDWRAQTDEEVVSFYDFKRATRQRTKCV